MDSYDMVRWPIVRRGRTAYVRYRFHTRNLEMLDPLKKLTRAVPDVRIALVTHCLDDGDFGAYSFEKGRMKGKGLGEQLAHAVLGTCSARAQDHAGAGQ